MQTNTTSRRCDHAISTFDLLDHPFYRAWSDGTLAVAALRDYARDYGAFIAAIDGGWRTLGEAQIADHEVAHARLWEETFAAALGTRVVNDAPQTPPAAALLATTRDLFAAAPSATGALYAFEAQQPKTANSKLLGLKSHYAALPAACGEYFELHSGDYDETTLLVERMGAMNEADSNQAVAACRQMSQALYEALSAIHAPYAQACE
jgi:pyrroloquinoline-quinone synthase